MIADRFAACRAGFSAEPGPAERWQEACLAFFDKIFIVSFGSVLEKYSRFDRRIYRGNHALRTDSQRVQAQDRFGPKVVSRQGDGKEHAILLWPGTPAARPRALTCLALLSRLFL